MGMSENIKNLSPATFKDYGSLIEYPDVQAKGKNRNLWKVLYRSDDDVGWRIAYLVLRDKSIGRLECHPDTDETFEPIKGKAVIFVSRTREICTLQAFWLDRPIIVFRGIWHGIVTVARETHIKICENKNVSSSITRLPRRVSLETYRKFIARNE